MKRSKKYLEAKAKVEAKAYDLREALENRLRARRDNETAARDQAERFARASRRRAKSSPA